MKLSNIIGITVILLVSSVQAESMYNINLGVSNKPGIPISLGYKSYISPKVFTVLNVGIHKFSYGSAFEGKGPYDIKTQYTNRLDTSFRVGLGYSLNKVDVSLYGGLGKSNKTTTLTEDKTTSSTDKGITRYYRERVSEIVTKETQLREEVGFKLQYNIIDTFGTFIEASQVSYGGKAYKGTGGIGMAFRF